jgi:hypothetical protein
MNTKRLLLSVTLLLSINVCIVLYLLNASSSSYNIKITNKYHVIYNNNFDFDVKSAGVSPSTVSSSSFDSPSTMDSMIPTFMDKISLKTSTDKISLKTSTDKISLKTPTDKISMEENKNLMETENQLLLDYDYNKKNETGLPYIFERMFTFFIYSL